MQHETHPWKPFLPEGTQILILGSFPPPRNRWCMDFYYPNFQNDFWRILGLVFFGEKDYFVCGGAEKKFDLPKIEAFLTREKIGLYDTVFKACRLKQNASDAFLEVVTPVDIPELLRKIPECHTLASTGEKATEMILKFFNAKKPAVGGSSEFSLDGRTIRFARLPSSSRAYPLPVKEKAEMYARVMRDESL